jgi:hypothetical protein
MCQMWALATKTTSLDVTADTRNGITESGMDSLQPRINVFSGIAYNALSTERQFHMDMQQVSRLQAIYLWVKSSYQ